MSVDMPLKSERLMSNPLGGCRLPTLAGAIVIAASRVDNAGGYLDFVGEFRDGTVTLHRTAQRGGKEIK